MRVVWAEGRDHLEEGPKQESVHDREHESQRHGRPFIDATSERERHAEPKRQENHINHNEEKTIRNILARSQASHEGRDLDQPEPEKSIPDTDDAEDERDDVDEENKTKAWCRQREKGERGPGNQAGGEDQMPPNPASNRDAAP